MLTIESSDPSASFEHSIRLLDEHRELVPMLSPAPTVIQAPDWVQDGQWFSANLRELFAGILVSSIAVDDKGELWIASNLGLFRYDGFQYVHFDMNVDGGLGTDLKLVFDKQGRLWMIDYRKGIFLFEEGQLYHFELGPGVFDYLADVFVAEDGSVWFCGQLGVFRFQNGRFQIVESHENYRLAAGKAVGISSQGSLWIAGPSNRLHRYYKDQLAEVPGWNQDRSILRKSYGSFAFNRSNEFYLNARDGQILRFEDAPLLDDIQSQEVGQMVGGIKDLAFDHHERVWGAGQSAYRLDRNRNRFSASDSGLIFSDVESVVSDSDGTVWVCSQFDGLARYRNSNVEELPLPDVHEPYTTSIEWRDDHLLFGTKSSGVVAYHDGLVEQYTSQSTDGGLISDSVTVLERDALGGVWVGTSRGPCYVSAEKAWRHFKGISGAPKETVNGLKISPEGDVWVAGRDGLFRLRNGSWEKLTLGSTSGAPLSEVIRGLAFDPKGRLWISSASWISIFDKGEWGNPIDLHDTVSAVPRSILFGREEGTVWFGTDSSGVYRFDGALPGGGYDQISLAQGLPDVGVTCLLLDSSQRLWVGTKNGLCLIEEGLSVAMGRRDGIRGTRVTDLIELSHGAILVTTESGAATYTPKKEFPKIIAEVLGEKASGDSLLVPSIPSDQAVEIELRGYSDSTSSQQMNFVYRLRGESRDWIVAKNEKVVFDSLPAGRHQLEAMAIDRDLVSSVQPVVLNFAVVYPYRVWIQWAGWFVLCGGSVFAAWLAWVRNRQRNQSRAVLVQRTMEHNHSLMLAKNDADEARRHAEEASRAKSEFLANISHEIRTPMNAIVGFSRFFSDPVLSTEKRLELAKSVQRSSQHLLGMVNDVLDFSKIEAGKIELEIDVFDLGALVNELDEVYRLRCANEDLEWRVSVEIETPYFVKGDLKHLRQILTNLIGNAVKFTEAGFVSLRLSHELGQDEEGRGIESRFRFEVADSGAGIGDEDQKAIFDVFEQGQRGREKGGAGLGLGIANRLAALMSGGIQVKSVLGEGTTFVLSLPLEVSCETRAARPGKTREASRRALGDRENRVKALIIDDVDDNRLLLRMLLEQMNVEVMEAASGRTGLALVSDWNPEIILMDLRMPAMSGFEVLTRLRENERHQSLPVIAVTASAFSHEREACLDRGFDGFLSKPIETNELEDLFLQFTNLKSDGRDRSNVGDGNASPKFGELDGELLQKLRLLVAQYRRTELKETLLDLKDDDGPHYAIATHFLDLVSSGDWKGLSELIDGNDGPSGN